MWTVKPASMPVQFLRGERSGEISVGFSQPPPRNHDVIRRLFCSIPMKSQTSESEPVGQQILLRSSDTNRNKPIPKEKEISGSDVLWAIQRATAQKKRSNANKKTKKKIIGVVELSSSAGETTEDNGVDYSNVRPLKIKSDWGQRLDEFEKLLKEFQDMEL